MATETNFFSYSRTDSDFVLKLAKDLRDAGAELWLDQLDIIPGSRWDASIEKALDASACLIVILSPTSVASNNVMDEVSFALENGKKVIPVLLNDCKLPFRLRRLQHIDFTHDYKTGFNLLLQALNLASSENKRNIIRNLEQATTEETKNHKQQMPVENESLAIKAQSKNPKKYLFIAAGILLSGFVIWRITQIGSDNSDLNAWNQALQKNDSTAFSLYQDHFPDGEHYEEAKEKLNSLKKVTVNLSVTDTSTREILPANQEKLHKDLDNKFQSKNYFVVIGSHTLLDDAKAQADLLSTTNIIYKIQVYKNENNIYAVCLDGQLTDNVAAKVRLTYAIENIKIKDAYIKSSSLWQQVEYIK